MTIQPKPELEAIISAAISVVQPIPIATRTPVKISGTALGRIT